MVPAGFLSVLASFLYFSASTVSIAYFLFGKITMSSVVNEWRKTQIDDANLIGLLLVCF